MQEGYNTLKASQVVPRSQHTPEARDYISEEEEVSDTNYELTPQSDVEPGFLEDFKRVTEAVIGEVWEYIAGPFIVWGDCFCENCGN